MQHFHSEPEPQSVYAVNTAPQHTAVPPAPLDMAEQRRLQETLEDYLDRVCRPLLDTLPYAARQELRQEIAQHLSALVQAYRESGYAPALATEKALEKFGPPHLVAQKWSPVPLSRQTRRSIEQWFTGQWQGMAATLILCGAAGLLGLMLHRSGALTSHGLVFRPQSHIVSALPPRHSPRPVSIASLVNERVMLTDLAAQAAALQQARAELMAAQSQLQVQEISLQNLEMTAARAWTAGPAIGATLQMRRVALNQQNLLEQQRMQVQQMRLVVEERQAALAQAAARLEFVRSQRVQPRL